MSGKIDRKKLFNHIRHAVFHGHFTQGQVDGLDAILDAWEADERMTDLRWLAYMLGTAYHETAATMKPIREYGSKSYLIRQYDVNGRRPNTARKMGNVRPGDGVKYCGRGYVQLTWHDNYLRLGKEIGVDLVNDPDLALDPGIAARVMFEGMTRRDVFFEDHTIPGGFTFTGKALEDYFNARTDWVGARRIVNGTDHAWMIAETAQDFFAGLSYQREVEHTASVDCPCGPTPDPEEPSVIIHRQA